MMSVGREPLQMDGGKSVSNCIEYLNARAAGMSAKTDPEVGKVTAEYMICDALQALQEAKPLTHPVRTDIGTQLAQRLDLRSVLPADHSRVQGLKFTLTALDRQVDADATTVRVQDGRGRLRLEVIAEADFDDDERLDWLLWMIDEPRRGTPAYRTFVITNVEREGTLHAREYRPGD